MILNESAVKLVGMKRDIVGETIQFNDKNYTVVGVIKDMIMESPYKPVQPTVFLYDPNWANVITVAIKQGAPVKTALSKIETVFKKFNPGSPFNYTFNDEDYAKKFSDEERVGNLATFFTILAIFISCPWVVRACIICCGTAQKGNWCTQGVGCIHLPFVANAVKGIYIAGDHFMFYCNSFSLVLFEWMAEAI